MKIKITKYLFIAVFFFLMVSCTYKKYYYHIPQDEIDGIETGSMADANIDTAQINLLVTKILNNDYRKIHSLLIMKNGKLICEEYFNGYSAEMLHPLYSAGKSIGSTMIGIAIDKGFIKDTEQTLLDLFPEHLPDAKLDNRNKDIKLKHILTMTTGLDCGDSDDFENSCSGRLIKEKDPIKYILELPMSHNPGDHFFYNDGTPKIIQVIIEHCTKMRYNHFQYKYLYTPLDISVYRPSPGLTPREMAKIGSLYLNKGKWRGEQLLSEKWVEETAIKHVKTKYGHYGYLWWNSTFTYPDREIETFYAAGNGGQFIFVFPELDMVVVTTGGNVNEMKYTVQPMEMLDEYIIPAVL